MTTTSKIAAPPQPWMHQHGHELQAFGTVRDFPAALPAVTRLYSCPRLNRGVDAVPDMLARLPEVYEPLLAEAHDAAGQVDQEGEDGTDALIVPEVIRDRGDDGVAPRRASGRHRTGPISAGR